MSTDKSSNGSARNFTGKQGPVVPREHAVVEEQSHSRRPIASSGPYTPDFESEATGYKIYRHDKPFHFRLEGAVVPRLDIAYETWGQLNQDKSNAVLVIGGVSSSSHISKSKENPKPGWWDSFLGSGCVLDPDRWHIIGLNVLGSCYGTTGPRSIREDSGKEYGSTFPMVTIQDMASAVSLLLDHLGIAKVHCLIGGSLGGMVALQCAVDMPDRVGKLVSLSSCLRSEPYDIAMRHLQCSAIRNDPNWRGGFYYGTSFPFDGLVLASSLGMATYRSSQEWSQRFSRNRLSTGPPTLAHNFQVESYLSYQGEKFCRRYDPNSYLYLSKAMDLFDISEGYSSAEESLSRVQCPVLVIGVDTDILFPISQQKLLRDKLQAAGNNRVTFLEVNSPLGHDTFLLDRNGFGVTIKGFLETELRDYGSVSLRAPSSMRKSAL